MLDPIVFFKINIDSKYLSYAQLSIKLEAQCTNLGWDLANLTPVGVDWGWAYRVEEMAGGWPIGQLQLGLIRAGLVGERDHRQLGRGG